MGHPPAHLNATLLSRSIVHALMAGSALTTKLAAQLAAVDNPTEEDYLLAAAAFKVFAHNTTTSFKDAIDVARWTKAQVEAKEDITKQMASAEHGEMHLVAGTDIEEDADNADASPGETMLEDRIMQKCDRWLKVNILPAIQWDYEGHLEDDVIPSMEERVLRRLLDRLHKFKYTHPLYDTLITGIVRKLGGSIAEDVEYKLYDRMKVRLLMDVQDTFNLRPWKDIWTEPTVAPVTPMHAPSPEETPTTYTASTPSSDALLSKGSKRIATSDDEREVSHRSSPSREHPHARRSPEDLRSILMGLSILQSHPEPGAWLRRRRELPMRLWRNVFFLMFIHRMTIPDDDHPATEMFRPATVQNATSQSIVPAAAERLIRWTDVHPNEIFWYGFQPWVSPAAGNFLDDAFNLRQFVDTNSPSIFVAAARYYRNARNILVRWRPCTTRLRFEYEIFAYGGIDVNAVLGDAHQYASRWSRPIRASDRRPKKQMQYNERRLHARVHGSGDDPSV
ncbi:hypothetical protein OH76DRAFT_1485755 [Lentinus brumalis]|uniref:Pierisin-like domain-containing protein n=1 Tax=Lentinus brumalis TaxID=2498619 RepID=A0A371D0U7_9APHY|nr:hypothetical protein OH76DRAFT_1485755 [Polyporus brumalis]